jgi:thioredoxin-related protein
LFFHRQVDGGLKVTAFLQKKAVHNFKKKYKLGKIINLSFIAAAVLLLIVITIVVTTFNRSTDDTTIIDSQNVIHFFTGAMNEAVALSRKENKPMFLLAHASYSSSCKKMKKNILPLKEVGDVFNKNFINAQVDIESEEGIKIVKDFEVAGTPTLLFLTPDGQVISKSTGYQNKEELLALANTIKPINN